jgi:hypothetical protein
MNQFADFEKSQCTKQLPFFPEARYFLPARFRVVGQIDVAAALRLHMAG